MICKTRCLAACLGVLLSVAGCGDEGGGDIQSTIERLSPTARVCVTSDTCIYGYCSTEDGDCNLAPGCSQGGNCPPACYGICVAAAPPER